MDLHDEATYLIPQWEELIEQAHNDERIAEAFKNLWPFLKCFPPLNNFPKGNEQIKDKILSEFVKFLPVTKSTPNIASPKFLRLLI